MRSTVAAAPSSAESGRAGLRREAGAFFFFLLISFMTLLTMSGIFRTIGSLSRSLAQAVAPAAVLILALVIYTGEHASDVAL